MLDGLIFLGCLMVLVGQVFFALVVACQERKPWVLLGVDWGRVASDDSLLGVGVWEEHRFPSQHAWPMAMDFSTLGPSLTHVRLADLYESSSRLETASSVSVGKVSGLVCGRCGERPGRVSIDGLERMKRDGWFVRYAAGRGNGGVVAYCPNCVAWILMRWAELYWDMEALDYGRYLSRGMGELMEKYEKKMSGGTPNPRKGGEDG